MHRPYAKARRNLLFIVMRGDERENIHLSKCQTNRFLTRLFRTLLQEVVKKRRNKQVGKRLFECNILLLINLRL